jgi:hypothetical protein
MAKQKKSRDELEAMVLIELRRTVHCRKVLSISVVDLNVDGLTWEVSSYNAGDAAFENCEKALNTIVPRLQAVYDLKMD